VAPDTCVASHNPRRPRATRSSQWPPTAVCDVRSPAHEPSLSTPSRVSRIPARGVAAGQGALGSAPPPGVGRGARVGRTRPVRHQGDRPGACSRRAGGRVRLRGPAVIGSPPSGLGVMRPAQAGAEGAGWHQTACQRPRWGVYVTYTPRRCAGWPSVSHQRWKQLQLGTQTHAPSAGVLLVDEPTLVSSYRSYGTMSHTSRAVLA
jgi:hypothetical protein